MPSDNVLMRRLQDQQYISILNLDTGITQNVPVPKCGVNEHYKNWATALCHASSIEI